VGHFEQLSDDELVSKYGQIMAALLERGIVRSANNPIADIAERFVADHFGVEQEPPNSKSVDVIATDGTRIQVKALRRTKSGRNRLSAIRSLDFDILAAVIFRLDMQLEEIALIPLQAVEDHMAWSETWRANSLSLTKKLLADDRVERIPSHQKTKVGQ
jgi:hypothetical protein